MDVKRILAENNITPDRSKDQFFLTDEKVIDKEISLASLTPSDTVLEIGPGPGNLTERIAKKCKVIAIEKDFAFRALLKGIPNTNVVFGDAVEVLESLRGGKAQRPAVFNKIVSNIPYSRTQDILIELLQHKWDTAVLVVQKEFASKLTEKEKIALAVEETCSLNVAGSIPAGTFYPTAVDSSILVLKQKRTLDPEFWSFLLLTYRDRNRNVGGVIKKWINASPMRSFPLPTSLAKKKIHQMTLREMKILFEYQKAQKEGSVK